LLLSYPLSISIFAALQQSLDCEISQPIWPFWLGGEAWLKPVLFETGDTCWRHCWMCWKKNGGRSWASTPRLLLWSRNLHQSRLTQHDAGATNVETHFQISHPRISAAKDFSRKLTVPGRCFRIFIFATVGYFNLKALSQNLCFVSTYDKLLKYTNTEMCFFIDWQA